MLTILVTAGATREHLDDVRFLSNGSTGRMGYAIAEAAVGAGHRVTLVSGPTHLEAPALARHVPVTSALEMLAAVEREFTACDTLFAVAAVADQRPARRAAGKPPKAATAAVELVANPDIVATVATRKGPRLVVGFALETGAGAEERARRKLLAKHLDCIVLNGPAGLGATRNAVTMLYPDGRREPLPDMTKAELAIRLVRFAEHWHAAGDARGAASTGSGEPPGDRN